VAEAATRLLGSDPAQAAFVEVGAEPGGGLFAGRDHPFRDVRTIGIADPVGELPTPCIVFANELLDAQPFERFQFADGAWRALGVALDETGQPTREVVLPEAHVTPTLTQAIAELPSATEGSRCDWSLEAEELLRRLVTPKGVRAVLLFDYGGDLPETLSASPQGTARAYRAHRQETDLLAHPGEQDLTCPVFWDRLEAVLRSAGFETQPIRRQEAFFLTEAPDTVHRILTTNTGAFSPDRQTLQALLHPAHFGHRFQSLTATRPS
jgi:SAM-dependent MidA family methyltransferase